METKQLVVVATSGSKRVLIADRFVVDDRSRVIVASQGNEIVGIFPCENVQAAYWGPSESIPRS